MHRLLGMMVMAALLVGCTGTVGGGGGGDGEAGGADAGPNDPPPTPPPDDETCDQVEPIELQEAQPPDLLLVVDKSGSMADPLGTGEIKWTVMRNALNQVVAEYQDGINFGLMLYPTGDVCDPGQIASGIAPANATAIAGALAATQPVGGTPTHTTMTGARTYYQGAPVNPNGRYVLLATDGQPNCASADDPGTPTVTESIAAITALSGDGVPTFVLGFGSAINADPATLQAMAEAGGTTAYYAANTPADLLAALDAIAGEIGLPECRFELVEVPEDPDRLGVYFDDDAVPRSPSHADGWDYDPATNTITFYGAACDRLQSGDVSEVRVDYGCGGPIVL